ncbi:GntR-family transcriptional regulator [Sodalis praecaptivus]|uniref:GntR-family transcriptional regulator n=1 Tax=Sodalis praecaptivus TaxID=1239307 RepID=W0HMQ6_9GAMM|nr:FCD domain-containing protein [Sodalis praecaptivus]AHF75176.1 GntR-family transcriptional regulator [Sodalis praecaptivus]
MNTPDTLTLLRTQSLTNLVQEELERRIVAGQLTPGAPLREAAIAAEMGISRGPVREAFRMLEERGLVLFEKNCGVRIRRLDMAQALQIYQVRIPLEELAGTLVAQHLTPAGAEDLGEVLRKMAVGLERQDIALYTPLNFQFHDLLVKYTGNPSLYDTYRRLVVQLELFRSYTFRHNPQTITLSFREHHAIFDAVLARDAALAGRLLRQHAQDSLRRLEQAALSS